MCDCNKINILSSPHLKIYTAMAEYKKNDNAKGVRMINGRKVDFRIDLTQEQLSFAYEELGMTDCINKVDKTIKSDEESSAKKSSKKGKSSKEASEEK